MMDAKKVLSDVLQSNAAVEIMNELVAATLKSSRECLFVELKRFSDIKKERPLSYIERDDEETIKEDIEAINRTIDYYGGSQ